MRIDEGETGKQGSPRAPRLWRMPHAVADADAVADEDDEEEDDDEDEADEDDVGSSGGHASAAPHGTMDAAVQALLEKVSRMEAVIDGLRKKVKKKKKSQTAGGTAPRSCPPSQLSCKTNLQQRPKGQGCAATAGPGPGVCCRWKQDVVEVAFAGGEGGRAGGPAATSAQGGSGVATGNSCGR